MRVGKLSQMHIAPDDLERRWTRRFDVLEHELVHSLSDVKRLRDPFRHLANHAERCAASFLIMLLGWHTSDFLSPRISNEQVKATFDSR